MKRVFVCLVVALMVALGPVGTGYALSDAEYRELLKDPDFRFEDALLGKVWKRVYGSLSAADKKILLADQRDWLKNRDGSDTLEDYSDLTDIKNVKGDETFTKKSDGSLLWDAQGKDIYYQGKSSEELPVSVKISYTLDGQPISPEKLAGKSGKVTIRFDYENHAKETVKVKGSEYEIQTPFTMVSAMILPSDTFTNVQVKNSSVRCRGYKP